MSGFNMKVTPEIEQLTEICYACYTVYFIF